MTRIVKRGRERGRGNGRHIRSSKSRTGARKNVSDENYNTLFEAARSGSAALIEVAKGWVKDFEADDPESAMLEALNCLLLTAVGGTCRSDYKPLSIDEDDVNPSLMSMTTEQWDHLIELYIEEVAHPQEIDNPAEQTSADVFCPLMLHLAATKAKAWKGFRDNFGELWRRIASAACEGGRVNAELLENLVEMFITLCNTPLVGLRVASTIAGMEFGEGLIVVRRDAIERVSKIGRQIVGSNKGGAAQANKARTLREQLAQAKAAELQSSEAVDALFHGILAHRYKDVHSDVRACVLTELSKWGVALPSYYVRDEILRYLGWALDDSMYATRLAALKGLHLIYVNAASKDSVSIVAEDSAGEANRLRGFTNRFLTRILVLTRDKSEEVCVVALNVLRVQYACGLLDSIGERLFEEVYCCIFDADLVAASRAVALAFYIDTVEAFNEEVCVNKNDEVNTTSQLSSFVEIIAVQVKSIMEDEQYNTLQISAFDVAKASADMVVEAAWALPQRSVLFQWEAYARLLQGGDGEPGSNLEETDRVSLLRLMTSTILNLENDEKASSVRGGKGMPGRVPAREAAEHLDMLAEKIFPSLPHIVGALKAEPVAMELLLAIPKAAAKRGITLLVGKRLDFIGALKCLQDVLEKEGDESILEAASEVFGDLVSMDGGEQDAAETQTRKLFEDISTKVLNLVADLESDNLDWEVKRNTEFSLGVRLKRLRHVASRLDPIQRLDTIGQFWRTTKNAIVRLSDLSATPLPPAEDCDAHLETAITDLDVRSNILKEGCILLTVIFMWSFNSLLQAVSEETSKLRHQLNQDDSSEIVEDAGDDEQAIEEEERESSLMELTQNCVEMRDDLLAVLEAVLSMNLEQKDGDDMDENHYEERTDLGIVAEKSVEAIRACAYMLANILRALLKRTLDSTAYVRMVCWAPDREFTGLLQAHFEARECRLAWALECGKEGEEEASILAQELLQPLVLGLWSNADTLIKRQAAVVLGHMVKSGPTACHIAKAFANDLKGLNPVKYLEVLLVTLFVTYDNWVVSSVNDVVSGEDEEEAAIKGVEMWASLAVELAKTIGTVPTALPRVARVALQQFMAKGLGTALDGAPHRLCFLEGLAPFVPLLSAAQRKYVGALIDESVLNSFSADVREEWEAVTLQLERNDHKDISRQWIAFYDFQQILRSGTGDREISPLKSPSERSVGTPTNKKSTKSKRVLSASRNKNRNVYSNAAAAAAEAQTLRSLSSQSQSRNLTTGIYSDPEPHRSKKIRTRKGEDFSHSQSVRGTKRVLSAREMRAENRNKLANDLDSSQLSVSVQSENFHDATSNESQSPITEKNQMRNGTRNSQKTSQSNEELMADICSPRSLRAVKRSQRTSIDPSQTKRNGKNVRKQEGKSSDESSESQSQEKESIKLSVDSSDEESNLFDDLAAAPSIPKVIKRRKI